MASSLSPECTPLKLEYDSCFNSWFEGYLESTTSPAHAALSSEDKEQLTHEKADEYERKCGAVWKSYRDCVQKAVTEKGLDQLLEEAREDNPLKDPPPASSDGKTSDS